MLLDVALFLASLSTLNTLPQLAILILGFSHVGLHNTLDSETQLRYNYKMSL